MYIFHAPIIDIGGGDSKLADFLIDGGFENISVPDISEKALERAKIRLREQGNKVTWIVSDITGFNPSGKYEVWHDGAAFHFLTSPDEINKYMDIARKAISGYLAIGTFSDKSPDKCSGLEIRKYSEEQLSDQFQNGFEKIRCITEDHITPFNTTQDFSFCNFKQTETH